MPYCDICHSETCEHQDRTCPCGCGDAPKENCVYDTPQQRHLKNIMNNLPDEQWVIDGLTNWGSDSTSSFDETKLPDEKDIVTMWQALKTDEPPFNQFWSGGDAWKQIKLVTDEIPLMSVDKEKVLGFPLTARKSLAGIPIYVYDMMPEDEIWAVKITHARPPELPEIKIVKVFKVKVE